MKKVCYPDISQLLLLLNDVCEHICRNLYQEPEILLNYVLKKSSN